MASAGDLEELKNNARCPKCRDFYKDPVTTKCSHSFCRDCIPETSYQLGGKWQLCCFVCNTEFDKRSLRDNPQLEKIVKAIREMAARPTCEEHPEQYLTFYCRRDEAAICGLCRGSEEHRAHSGDIAPLKEAVGQTKTSLQKRSDNLSKQLQDLEAWITEKKERAAELESNFNRKEASINDLYKEMYASFKKLLKEKNQQTLAALNEDRKKFLGTIQNKISDVEIQQMKHENMIEEIDEKRRQPDLELLKDAKRMLDRCDELKVDKPEIDFDKPLQSVLSHSSHCDFLLQRLAIFRERVTLNPDTAHPSLVLSEGGKVVMRTVRVQHLPPDHPKRFTVSRCVLGKTGFTTGQHTWGVEVLQNDGWAVGVALKSVARKKQVTQCPEGGIWAVKGQWGTITALTNPPTPLPNSQGVRKLGIYLNYEKRELSVYNADSWVKLYTFSDAAFQGTVYPYFWVGEGEHTGLSKRQKTTEGFNSKEEVLRLL